MAQLAQLLDCSILTDRKASLLQPPERAQPFRRLKETSFIVIVLFLRKEKESHDIASDATQSRDACTSQYRIARSRNQHLQLPATSLCCVCRDQPSENEQFLWMKLQRVLPKRGEALLLTDASPLQRGLSVFA